MCVTHIHMYISKQLHSYIWDCLSSLAYCLLVIAHYMIFFWVSQALYRKASALRSLATMFPLISATT